MIGLVLTDHGKRYNTAMYVPADGDAQSVYRQWYEGGTQFTPGRDLVFVSSGQTRVGLQVCMDLNFADPSRQAESTSPTTEDV